MIRGGGHMLFLDHIAINIIEAKESICFYTETMGLVYLGHIRMEDHTLYYCQLSGKVKLEMIEYDQSEGRSIMSIKTKGIYRHMALEVTDLDMFRKQILDTSCIMQDVSDCKKLCFKNMLLMDPNGVEIEVIERYRGDYNGNV